MESNPHLIPIGENVGRLPTNSFISFAAIMLSIIGNFSDYAGYTENNVTLYFFGRKNNKSL